MKKLINFNINNYVHVKLTDLGLKELEKQHRELKETFPKLHEYSAPFIDEEGYTKYQMHSLILNFGHMIFVGSNLPFETEIKIEVESEAK